MNDAIFLTSDDRIAGVTLAQAARFARLWRVDVHVFIETDGRGWTGGPRPEGLTLHVDALGGLIPADLPVTARWPRAIYGRVFAPARLGGYRRLLYVDPDVLSLAPDPAVWSLPMAGGLGAVRDVATILNPPRRARLDRAGWLASIGLPGGRYFNSGVLLIDAAAWAARNPAADLVAYAERHGRATQAPDQDFLNWAFPDWTELSPRWNFQAALFPHGYETAFDPVLLHFSGGDKPWFGPAQGWRTATEPRFLDAFRDLIREAGADPDRFRRDDRPGLPRRLRYGAYAGLRRLGVATPRERRVRAHWAAEAEAFHALLADLSRRGAFADLPARELGRPDPCVRFDGRHLVRPLDVAYPPPDPR